MKNKIVTIMVMSALAVNLTCNGGTTDMKKIMKSNDTGTDKLVFNGHTATVEVKNPDSATRQYSLSTNADLRDNDPAGKRVDYAENEGQMTIRTGSLMFDALFALAMYEARQDSVDSISDGAYNNGQPISAPPGGFFQTGKKWTYVWTRDTSYSVDLALAMVDPVRSKNSMLFKISGRRDVSGSPEIIQDTGSGGSWPVSTDRAVWALGAQELLKYLTGQNYTDFSNEAYNAIVSTIESDRKAIFDQTDGLYTGEQSFLDWREQTYPRWTAQNTVHIGMSKTLSTNVCQYIILTAASGMAAVKGNIDLSKKYAGWASDLKNAINNRFWLPSEGLYSSIITTNLDWVPTGKYDLLGESLAIISGIADTAKAESIMKNYPHSEVGAPVIWPQLPKIPIYHNRAIWPFVTAYCLRAAKKAGNDAVVSFNILSLMNGSAINLSNMENFEFITLSNWVGDSDYSGPVINSQRQLWSVAGYISMVVDIIFGRETTMSGIRFKPFITEHIRNTVFAGTNTLNLYKLAYKGKLINVTVNLPPKSASQSGYYSIGSVTLNNSNIDPDSYLPAEKLTPSNTIVVNLVENNLPPSSMKIVKNTGDWREYYAPLEPSIDSITAVNGLLKLTFHANETNGNPVFNIYRNGVKVASGLPSTTTSWTDPNSGDYKNKTYFYAVESQFTQYTNNASHHSQPAGYWIDGIEQINAGDPRLVSPQNAHTENNHGRFHYNNWGAPSDELIASYAPKASGWYTMQLCYGNAMNAVNTGITCCVKNVRIYDGGGNLIAEGVVFMPHMKDWDTWSESSFFPDFQLNSGQTYKIRISDYRNMSYFTHNEKYSGQGGTSGINNRCNISGVKILPLSK